MKSLFLIFAVLGLSILISSLLASPLGSGYYFLFIMGLSLLILTFCLNLFYDKINFKIFKNPPIRLSDVTAGLFLFGYIGWDLIKSYNPVLTFVISLVISLCAVMLMCSIRVLSKYEDM